MFRLSLVLGSVTCLIASSCRQKHVFDTRTGNVVSVESLGQLPAPPRSSQMQGYAPRLTENGTTEEITIACPMDVYVALEEFPNQLQNDAVGTLQAGTHIAVIGTATLLLESSGYSSNVEVAHIAFPDSPISRENGTNISEGYVLVANLTTTDCATIQILGGPQPLQGQPKPTPKNSNSPKPINNPGQNTSSPSPTVTSSGSPAPSGGSSNPSPTVGSPSPSSSSTATPSSSATASPSPNLNTGRCTESGVVAFHSTDQLETMLTRGGRKVIGCSQQYQYFPNGVQNIGSTFFGSCVFPGLEFRTAQGGKRAVVAKFDGVSDSSTIKIKVERVLITNGSLPERGRCPENFSGSGQINWSNFARQNDNCKPPLMEKSFTVKNLSKVGGYYVLPFSTFVENPNNWVGIKGTIKLSVADSTNRPCEMRFALISPLVLDFSGDTKVATLNPSDSGVEFDWDGNGIPKHSGWIEPHTALLGLDRNGNGLIDDGTELIGENTLRAGLNGYETLRILSQGATEITPSHPIFAKLIVWFDRNSDGVMQLDEKYSLSDMNVTRLSLKYKVSRQSTQVLGQNDVRFESRFFGPKSCPKSGCKSYDIYFATTEIDTGR